MAHVKIGDEMYRIALVVVTAGAERVGRWAEAPCDSLMHDRPSAND